MFLNLTEQKPFRVVSAAGRVALESRSGPIYEGWVRNACFNNPQLSIQEVHQGLAQLLGPSSIEELFNGKCILKHNSVVVVDGTRIDVLETDLNLLLCAQITVMSAKRALLEATGGSMDAYLRFRAERSRKDGTQESEIDDDVLTIYRGMVEAAIERARQNARTNMAPNDHGDDGTHERVTTSAIDRAIWITVLILLALVPIVLVLSHIFKLG